MGAINRIFDTWHNHKIHQINWWFSRSRRLRRRKSPIFKDFEELEALQCVYLWYDQSLPTISET